MKTSFIKIWVAVSVLSVMAGCTLDAVYDVGDRCAKAPEYYIDNGTIYHYEGEQSESVQFALDRGYCPKEYPKCALDKDGNQYCHQACEKGLDEDGREIVSAFCNRSCVSTMRDNVFCGARGDCWSDDPESQDWKGVSCRTGEMCESGQCMLNCPSGTHRGDKTQACEPDSNENCGATGVKCVDPQICSQGSCVSHCGADEIKCKQDGAEICVDPLKNTLFCGADENCLQYQKCTENQVCEGGICVCDDTTQQCGRLCCPIVENGYATCADGHCGYACNPGYIDNGARCCFNMNNGTILQNGNDSCDFTCDEGYVAKGGSCVPEKCTEGDKTCINSEEGVGAIYQCTGNEWVKAYNCESSNVCLADDSDCGGCQYGYQSCKDGVLKSCVDGLLDESECTTTVANAKGVCASGVSCGQYECVSGYTDNGAMCCPNVSNGAITKDGASACHFKCNSGYVESGGSCVSSQCTEGEEKCENGADYVGFIKMCKNNEWVIVDACPDKYSCLSDGKECSNVCRNNMIKCIVNQSDDDDVFFTCVNGIWGEKSSCVPSVANAYGACYDDGGRCGKYKCKMGFVDSGTNCVPKSNYCEKDGEVRCFSLDGTSDGAGIIRECVNHAWLDIQTCNGNSCIKDKECGACHTGDTICTNDSKKRGSYKICKNGLWGNEAYCANDNSCDEMGKNCGDCVNNSVVCVNDATTLKGATQTCTNGKWGAPVSCKGESSCIDNKSCGYCISNTTECVGSSAIRGCRDARWGDKVDCPVHNNSTTTCSNGQCDFECDEGYHKNNDECVLDVVDCGESHTDCTAHSFWADGACVNGKCVVSSCTKDAQNYDRVPSADGSVCVRKYYNCKKEFPRESTNPLYYDGDNNYFCISGKACAEIGTDPTACVRWHVDCAKKTEKSPDKYYACQNTEFCINEPDKHTEFQGESLCTYHPLKYFDKDMFDKGVLYSCEKHNKVYPNYACNDIKQCALNPDKDPENCTLRWQEVVPGIFCKYSSTVELAKSGIRMDKCIVLDIL